MFVETMFYPSIIIIVCGVIAAGISVFDTSDFCNKLSNSDKDTKNVQPFALNESSVSEVQSENLCETVINKYIKLLENFEKLITENSVNNEVLKLKAVIKEIQKEVKENPTLEKMLKKTLNYYLPTLSNLLETYLNIEQKSIIGDDANNLKLKILETLSVSDDALTEILYRMRQEKILEATVEAEVLQISLKGEISEIKVK